MALSPIPPETDPYRESLDEIRARKRKSVMNWLAILLGVVVLYQIVAPPRVGIPKKRLFGQAANNIRQIGLSLVNFSTKYGRFPDASTIPLVKKDAGASWKLGTASSNDYLRQLIASQLTKSEAIFYAQIKGSRKPDDAIDDAHALERGECGFSYILGALPTDTARPVLISPMIPGTTRCDPKPFERMAIIWRADGSVTAVKLDEAGNPMMSGKLLFDPANPVWNGRPPVIAWPE